MAVGFMSVFYTFMVLVQDIEVEPEVFRTLVEMENMARFDPLKYIQGKNASRSGNL